GHRVAESQVVALWRLVHGRLRRSARSGAREGENDGGREPEEQGLFERESHGASLRESVFLNGGDALRAPQSPGRTVLASRRGTVSDRSARGPRLSGRATAGTWPGSASRRAGRASTVRGSGCVLRSRTHAPA